MQQKSHLLHPILIRACHTTVLCPFCTGGPYLLLQASPTHTLPQSANKYTALCSLSPAVTMTIPISFPHLHVPLTPYMSTTLITPSLASHSNPHALERVTLLLLRLSLPLSLRPRTVLTPGTHLLMTTYQSKPFAATTTHDFRGAVVLQDLKLQLLLLSSDIEVPRQRDGLRELLCLQSVSSMTPSSGSTSCKKNNHSQ